MLSLRSSLSVRGQRKAQPRRIRIRDNRMNMSLDAAAAIPAAAVLLRALTGSDE
jgi:hypothetical protein